MIVPCSEVRKESSKGLFERSGAVFSACGKHRYRLWRRWGEGPVLMFCMLNPSTADESRDDPTIRRCIHFARGFGYDGIEVVNVCSYRSSSPRMLLKAAREGIDVLQGMAVVAGLLSEVHDVVVAWGSLESRPGWLQAAADRYMDLFCVRARRIFCLEFTKHGDPRHPLFCRKDAKLIDITPGKQHG